MRVRLFVTGGTFDKRYDPVSQLFVFSETNGKRILAEGRNRLPVSVEVLTLKDSLDLSERDFQHLLAKCHKAKERRLLVTIGTDRMVDVARLLDRQHGDKTIVLTGAMVPFSCQGSDAAFNFGLALGAVQTLPPGTYVAMNGQIFTSDAVIKNRQLARFEPVK
jgi:L-asparaginase